MIKQLCQNLEKRLVVYNQVRKLEDDRIEGFSENFGDLTLNLYAFVGMRFNLYEHEDRRQNDFLSHPAFED